METKKVVKNHGIGSDRVLEILKAIGHHDRLHIVTILFSGEFRVKQLRDKLGLLH